MTYTHLTPNDLVIIEAYFHQETPVAIVAKKLERGRQAINNVYRFLKQGKKALDYLERYQKNKKRCRRKLIEIPVEEKEYIKEKTKQGGTSDHVLFEPYIADFRVASLIKTSYLCKGNEKQTAIKNVVENKHSNEISLNEKRIKLLLKQSSDI